jgi:hypothetical protein
LANFKIMYLVINKTRNAIYSLEGNWNSTLIHDLLDTGNDIIVISLYSHTVKLPTEKDEDGWWQWHEYDLPIEEIGQYFNQYGTKKR